MSKFILIFIGLCSISHFSCAQALDARTLVNNMLMAIENAKHFECELHSEERFDNDLQKNKMSLKMSTQPKRFYLKTSYPRNGAEILFNPDLYGEKVYLNPGIFLVPNMKLKINNSLLLNRQHHSLQNVGLNFFKEVIVHALDKAGDDFEQVFSVLEPVEWDDKSCYILQIIDPTYTTTTYQVKSDEDIFSICNTLKISEYSIIELNKTVKDFNDIKPGMNLTVPTSYAPKSTIYIDKENFMPVKQLMEDEHGIFENYEMKNFVIRSAFDSNEFDPTFDAYDF